jgi:hypothetical protein
MSKSFLGALNLGALVRSAGFGGFFVMLSSLMAKQMDDRFNEEETARRRDAALLRALGTPHKPHSAMKLGNRKTKPSQKASPGVPSDSGKSKQRSK